MPDGTGVLWQSRPIRFRPVADFDRKAVAAIIGVQHKTIALFDTDGSALRRGRIVRNRRVVRYPAPSLVEFISDSRRPVNVLAAIECGFPISALNLDLLAVPVSSSRSSRVLLEQLPYRIAAQLCEAYSAWAATHDAALALPNAMVAIPRPVEMMDVADELTWLAALTESTLPKAKCAAWALRTGHSVAHVQLKMSALCQVLRQQLSDPVGQLLIRAVLRNHTAQSARPVEDRSQQGSVQAERAA